MSNGLIATGGSASALSILNQQSAGDLALLDKLSQPTTFLPRIQLYTKGKPIDKKLIESGHFGVPKQGDEILDLGTSIDILPLLRKAKAIDMSDADNLIVSNDPNSDEFKRIVHDADNKTDSGCAYGPTYLVFERTTGCFYEFFCGNKSARYESPKINRYLPVTPEMVAAGPPVTDEKEPRFAKPLTLRAVYIEKGRWSWHAPKAEDCLTPFDRGFDEAKLAEAVELFLKKDVPEVETAPSRSSGRRR